MQRVLIAAASQMLVTAVENQLKSDYLMESCQDGQRAMELIVEFDPDILVIDIVLPKVDGLSLLRTLRESGRSTRVVAIVPNSDDYVLMNLEKIGVSYIFRKPCAISAVVSCVRDVSFLMRYPDVQDWCLENELENILLDLGFRMGPKRYRCVYYAILEKYEYPHSSPTKHIYPEAAKKTGSNKSSIEKAIRDAIADAWQNGNRSVWQLYFPPGVERTEVCPSNDEFLARIAGSLRQRTRLKKPYRLPFKVAR